MSKYVAHGTTVSIAATPIGGLIAVSIPERTRGEAEVTDSNSGFDREFIGGLRDPGSMEMTMRHDPDDAGQVALEANFDALGGSEIEEFIITLPAAATTASGNRTYTFDGYVSQTPSGSLELADDVAAEVSVTVRLSGPVVIAP